MRQTLKFPGPCPSFFQFLISISHEQGEGGGVREGPPQKPWLCQVEEQGCVGSLCALQIKSTREASRSVLADVVLVFLVQLVSGARGKSLQNSHLQGQSRGGHQAADSRELWKRPGQGRALAVPS